MMMMMIKMMDKLKNTFLGFRMFIVVNIFILYNKGITGSKVYHLPIRTTGGTMIPTKNNNKNNNKNNVVYNRR